MIEGSHPSLFVTLDGMAGAGKTTTVRMLGPCLRNMGYRVHTTAEPTPGALGELARRNTDLYRGESLACLVAADRYHHLETEIEPHLREGDIVVCDRYIASSYVLQQWDGVPLAFVDALNNRARRPDLAVLLVADPAVAASRVAAPRSARQVPVRHQCRQDGSRDVPDRGVLPGSARNACRFDHRHHEPGTTPGRRADRAANRRAVR
ncbi:dTMP kinase [Saccharomonospora piscinae]|uniref:dTMP kinase n=1 Tax=Saccharomonospora piscinae TaxID=687388 RepID=UPI00111C27ED|nr:dTMP kinase [Saccharomonospora piscinae]